MKKFVLLFVLISTISYPCFAKDNSNSFELKNGERLKQYDKYGSYQGYYQQQGNRTKVYDRQGRYQGYYGQQGSRIKKYNRSGSYEGYYQK